MAEKSPSLQIIYLEEDTPILRLDPLTNEEMLEEVKVKVGDLLK